MIFAISGWFWGRILSEYGYTLTVPFLVFLDRSSIFFARKHFPRMLVNYPEPQGRRGAAGGRPEWEFLTVPKICQILYFLGSDVSEDPDSALYYTMICTISYCVSMQFVAKRSAF